MKWNENISFREGPQKGFKYSLKKKQQTNTVEIPTD